MKAKQAVKIAELIWNDTMRDESAFNQFMKLSPYLNELKADGNIKQLEREVFAVREEVVARWANIIVNYTEEGRK